jgi:hypothetical protein
MNYLYYNICLRITIANNIQFIRCSSIHIEESVEVLSNYAKIELPREFRNAIDVVGKSINIAEKSILNFIKKGDSIKIEFGYDNDLKTEFEGYITTVGSDIPLVLECEDEMYQLKRAPRINKFIKAGKLLDILKAVIPEKYKIECDADYTIGKWLIENATPYNVLDELRDKAGIRAYFKNSTTLVVGMKLDFALERIDNYKMWLKIFSDNNKKGDIDYAPKNLHYFNFDRNVRRGCDLIFKESEKPYHLKVESKQANGKTLSLSKGEIGGNETTITLWPGMAKSELQKWIDAMFNIATRDGFEGSLNGWCYPRTRAGDSAIVLRPYYKDRHQDGIYFIEGVTIDVNGSEGISRKNRLSYKLT